jgi:hypothetical protein
MRLGGKMHHGIRAVLRENTLDRRTIGDIRDFEGVATAFAERAERRIRSRIGEFVEIDDLLALAPPRCR